MNIQKNTDIKSQKSITIEKKNRSVLIIPYFGQFPNYFDKWLKSAEQNKDFSFYIFSDSSYKIKNDSNVKIFNITFEQLKQRIKIKLGKDIVLNSPYKLCDYRPAFGYIFEEEIQEFDFWGFCDIDLIFGKLSNFITEDMLKTYDKLFFHGHFCLFKNNERMKYLFKEIYPNVLDFQYASSTNYACHFDENGTVAYVNEYDKNINVYFDWVFCDPPYYNYEIVWGEQVCCAVWKEGLLNLVWNKGAESKEIMYIHLQKRTMHDSTTNAANDFVIWCTEFIDYPENEISNIFNTPVNEELKSFFLEQKKEKMIKQRINNFKSGSIRYRFCKFIRKWRVR